MITTLGLIRAYQEKEAEAAANGLPPGALTPYGMHGQAPPPGQYAVPRENERNTKAKNGIVRMTISLRTLCLDGDEWMRTEAVSRSGEKCGCHRLRACGDNPVLNVGYQVLEAITGHTERNGIEILVPKSTLRQLDHTAVDVYMCNSHMEPIAIQPSYGLEKTKKGLMGEDEVETTKCPNHISKILREAVTHLRMAREHDIPMAAMWAVVRQGQGHPITEKPIRGLQVVTGGHGTDDHLAIILGQSPDGIARLLYEKAKRDGTWDASMQMPGPDETNIEII